MMGLALRGVLIAIVLLSGCTKLRRHRAAAPPVILAPPSRAPEPPPAIPPPPPIKQAESSQIPSLPPAAQPDLPQPSRPPSLAHPPRRAATKRTTAPASPPALSSPAEAATSEASQATAGEGSLPQLGALLSSEQLANYNTAIDAALERAESNLAKLDTRRLRGQDRANYHRARAFIEQARQTRGKDLAVAKGLADRADILAQDLARSGR